MTTEFVPPFLSNVVTQACVQLMLVSLILVVLEFFFMTGSQMTNRPNS